MRLHPYLLCWLLALSIHAPSLALTDGEDPPPPDDSSDPPQEEVQERPSELVELPEILVTGRRQEDGVPEVPLGAVGSRDIFGPEQVRETGARDVNDLLLHLPAISTRPYNGGEAAAPSFSMRGLPDDGLTEYINVLIDGVPASPMPYGWTAFSFLPITAERIHAIDYIRGAHSVRYSPNTVGGVLNFITQPIPQGSRGEFRTTFGDFDYTSTMVSAGHGDEDLGWLVTYVDRSGDGYRENGDFSQSDFNFKLRKSFGSDSWLAFSTSYMANDHKAPGGLTLAEFEANRFGNARPRNEFSGYRGVADLVYHQDLQGDSWFEVFSYTSKTQRNLRAQRPHFPSPGDTLTISNWYDDSWVAAAGARGGYSFDALGAEHTLFGGVRYQREWIPSWSIVSEPWDGAGASAPLMNSKYSLDAISVHIDDTIKPTEKLTINAGVRLESIPSAKGENQTGAGIFDFDESANEVLPGLGASYMLTDDWSVFANYFQGFRAPQAWGFGLTPDPSNADIRFESAEAMELGTRYDGAAGFGGSITVWRNDYDDFFTFYSGFYENLGKIEATGVDVEAHWHVGEVIESLDGLSFLGSITFQDSELRSGPNVGNTAPYAWETKAAWRARYEFGGGWLATLGGTHVGESFSDEANTAAENANGNLGLNPSRVLWDAQVAKNWEIGEDGELRAMIGVTNLLDEEWYVHSRGGFFGGGKVSGPPQQAYIGLSYVLNF